MFTKCCDIINFKQKLDSFVTDTLITGDGFFEKQFTEPQKTLGGKTQPILGNIEQILTKTFWKINRDPHAQVLKHGQLVDGAQNKLSPEYIIHWESTILTTRYWKIRISQYRNTRRFLGKVDSDSGEVITSYRFILSVLDMQE